MRDGPSRLQIVDFLFLTQRVALLCDADEQKKRALATAICYLCASFLFSLSHGTCDQIYSVKSYMRDLAWSMTASSMYKKFPAPVVGHYVIILFLMQNPSKYFVCVSCRSVCVCAWSDGTCWHIIAFHCLLLNWAAASRREPSQLWASARLLMQHLFILIIHGWTPMPHINGMTLCEVDLCHKGSYFVFWIKTVIRLQSIKVE